MNVGRPRNGGVRTQVVLRINTDDGLDTFMPASFGFAYGGCGSNSTLWRGALRLRLVVLSRACRLGTESARVTASAGAEF